MDALTVIVAALTSAGTMAAVRSYVTWRAKVRLRELDVEEHSGQIDLGREQSGRVVLEDALHEKRAEYKETRAELAATRRELDQIRIMHAQCPVRITALEAQNAALLARVSRLERISEHPEAGRDTTPERAPKPPRLPR